MSAGTSTEMGEITLYQWDARSYTFINYLTTTYKVFKLFVDDSGHLTPAFSNAKKRATPKANAATKPTGSPPADPAAKAEDITPALYQVRLRKDNDYLPGYFKKQLTLSEARGILSGCYDQIQYFNRDMEKALFILSVITAGLTAISVITSTKVAGTSDTNSTDTSGESAKDWVSYGLAIFNILSGIIVSILKWMANNDKTLQAIQTEIKKIDNLLNAPGCINEEDTIAISVALKTAPEAETLKFPLQPAFTLSPISSVTFAVESAPLSKENDQSFGYHCLWTEPKKFWADIQKAFAKKPERLRPQFLSVIDRDLQTDYIGTMDSLYWRVEISPSSRKELQAVTEEGVIFNTLDSMSVAEKEDVINRFLNAQQAQQNFTHYSGIIPL
jgi:hypothetical protein